MSKIIFIVNHLGGGGIERVLIDVVKAMPPASITVLTLYDIDSTYKTTLSRFANIVSLDSIRKHIKLKKWLSIYSRIYDSLNIQNVLLRCFLFGKKIDKIIAFSDGRAVQLLSQNSFAKYYRIAWVHTDFLGKEEISDKIKLLNYHRTYNAFKKVVFVSKLMEKKFSDILELTNTICIPNAVDCNQLKQLASIENLEYIDHDKLNIAVVGRLSLEKGVDRIINCITKLSINDRNKVRLHIIGNGPERNSLKNLVNNSSLDNYVTFWGFNENPYPLLQQMSVLVSPSRFEGFGLVMLEAMALGVPVIATATTGGREITSNGEYGYIVENNDNALYQAILNYVQHPSILNNYKERMNLVADKYSIDQFVKNIQALL